ncbi:SMC family ATPase [Candidatus Woesearchaeota archaeon]|nr:SMC family ATPase [Candidatus Woesearchaeota archaeon]
MIFKSIKLHNIRSYTDETIVFPEGTILLSGDIGAGKSTILHAIEFALFGFIRGSLEGDALLRNGKHEGCVELASEISKKSVIIHRNLRRSNSVKQESGFIIIDDVKTDCTAIELKAKILELLGYSDDLLTKTKDLIYRYTVYTPQEAMKRILLESKETRLETLRRVFNVEKYKKIRENAIIIVKQLKLQRAYFEGLVHDIPEKEAQIKEYKLKIKELEANLQELLPQMSFIKDQQHEKRVQLQQQQQQVQEYYNAKQALAVEETRLRNLHELKEKIAVQAEKNSLHKEALKKELQSLVIEKPTDMPRDEIERSLQKLDEEYQEYKERQLRNQEELLFNTKTITQLRQEIEQKKIVLNCFELKKTTWEKLKSSKKDINFLKQEILNLEKNISVVAGYVTEHEITIDRAVKVKEKLAELNKCPTCLQEVNEEHKAEVYMLKERECHEAKKHLMVLNAEKKASEQQVYASRQALEQAQRRELEQEKLQVELASLERVDHEIKDKEKLLEKAEEIRSHIIKEQELLKEYKPEEYVQKRNQYKLFLEQWQKYHEINQQRQVKISRLSELETEEQMLSKNNGLASNELLVTKDKIMVASSKLQETKESEIRYKQFEQELEQLNLQEKKLSIEKTKLETEKQYSIELLEKRKQELDEKLVFQKKITAINQYTNWLNKFFVNITFVIEKQVMLQVYHEFNRIFIDWFKLLMGDEMISVRLDEEFTPVIEQNGYELDITSVSGGERTAVCLAYRLALNKVINEFMNSIATKDILILDEPTEGFSHEQLDQLKDVLGELLIKQVIMVSHEAKIESFVDTVIKIEKTGHISRVSFQK